MNDMGISEIKIKEYKCDGCGTAQTGVLDKDVFGIIGVARDHRSNAVRPSKLTTWFACSASCVDQAVINMLIR